MTLSVELIPILQDNYAYLLIAPDGEAAIVDPGEADPILANIKNKTLRLSTIINTHHHWDHINGNKKIMQATGAKLAAPASETNRIENISTELSEGDIFTFAGYDFQIFETPGHTSGHICLYCESEKILFSGDTLFSLGCGRLFEGTAEDMFSSMSKLRALPDDVRVYCGHEYTQSNLDFALYVDPNNEDLKARGAKIKTLRAEGKPTIPSLLGDEKKCNPFLKAKSAEELGALRHQKDNF